MEPEAQRWAEALAARRAASPEQGPPAAPPETVARIVAGALEARRQWVLDTWRSLSFRALLIAALAIAVLAIVYYARRPVAPPASILPLPTLESFPPAATP